ncbi:MAG: hypothetical protein ACTTH5_05195 [Wolinella sp.]
MEVIKYDEKTLIIKGDIKKESHYLELKEQLNALVRSGAQEIGLKIVHAKSISSSVLGYFLKLVRHDKIALKIEVSEEDLFYLFYDFSLIKILNVSPLEQ